MSYWQLCYRLMLRRAAAIIFCRWSPVAYLFNQSPTFGTAAEDAALCRNGSVSGSSGLLCEPRRAPAGLRM